MAYVPPPFPLSTEEFNRRVAKGAKTLAEIDPEFWEWVQSRRRFRILASIILSLGTLILTITAMIVLICS